MYKFTRASKPGAIKSLLWRGSLNPLLKLFQVGPVGTYWNKTEMYVGVFDGNLVIFISNAPR